MSRPLGRSLLLLFAVLAAAIVAATRAMRRDIDPLPRPAAAPTPPWPALRPDVVSAPSAPTAPAPAPAPDAPDAPETPDAPEQPAATSGPGWSDPDADGNCPDGFPLKGNLDSGIFHSPGQMAFERTNPNRCYADANAAIADGLRAAKR